MPIFESVCANQGQPCYGHKKEWFAHNRDLPDPDCPACGVPMTRAASVFASPLMRPLGDYGDPSKSGYHKQRKEGGHWVARKRSGGGTEQKPKFEFIDTFSKQRDYVKAEGLTNPGDFSPNVQVNSDGTKQSSSGLPGQWV